MEDASLAFYLPYKRPKDVAKGKSDGRFQSSSQILGLDQYCLA